MLKFLFLVFFLSASDAQRFKLNQRERSREGSEISDLINPQQIQDSPSYRLPNNTHPELYLINLNLGDFYANDLSFSGNVLISIRVVENTDTIILHSAVSVIGGSIRLTTVDNVAINQEVEFDAVREFMTVKVETPLEKDSLVRLYIEFRGSIGSSVAGIYRGSYFNNENEIR